MDDKALSSYYKPQTTAYMERMLVRHSRPLQCTWAAESPGCVVQARPGWAAAGAHEERSAAEFVASMGHPKM